MQISHDKGKDQRIEQRKKKQKYKKREEHNTSDSQVVSYPSTKKA